MYYFYLTDGTQHCYNSYRYAKEFYENNTTEIVDTNFRYL